MYAWFYLYNCNFFDDLYQKYNIEHVYANRCINSDAQNRCRITEFNQKLLATISSILED